MPLVWGLVAAGAFFMGGQVDDALDGGDGEGASVFSAPRLLLYGLAGYGAWQVVKAAR